METINDNKKYENTLIEKVNQDHHIIYLSEQSKCMAQQEQMIISSKKIEFYILSSLAFNFFKNTFLTIESCDVLIFHIKFREVTDLLNLNEIALLLTRINKINEVKQIELYINSTFNQNLENTIIIPSTINIFHISLHDDVKYFFSFGKSLPLLLNSNLLKLTLKDFKFNTNSQLSMFLETLLNTHCSELFLENIGIEILTKWNDFALTNYIEVMEDGIYFVFDDKKQKTGINKLSVKNASIIDVRAINSIIQNRNKSFELSNINRNSFLIFSNKIDSLKEENELLSISVDNDIDTHPYDINEMNIDDNFDLSFLNTDRTYNVLKLKHFDDTITCQQLNEIKVKEIHFISDSIDFINFVYSKLDKNILNKIVFNRIYSEEGCLCINDVDSITLKDSFCYCANNNNLKVNNVKLRYNRNFSIFQETHNNNVNIIQSILANNTFNEFTVEGESIINLLSNYTSQIKARNLIVQNIQGTKENISTITKLFTDVQSVTLNNFYFNRKEAIEISQKLSLVVHFINCPITIDYHTFINLLFHENPLCTSIEEFYLLSKELIPEPKRKDELHNQLQKIYSNAHTNLLKLFSLNKLISITYSNRKEYINIIYGILSFTKEFDIIKYISSKAENSTFGLSNYFISQESLNEFNSQFEAHFKLEKKKC